VNGVAVLRSNGNADVAVVRVVPVESAPGGLVLTHDGKLMIVADDEFIVFLDVEKITRDGADPVLGFFRTQRDAQSVYVNVTRDDEFAFVSDEAAASITVINLKLARQNGFSEKSIVGRIPTGDAPIALTFSPDGKLLYTTSEVALKEWAWPAKCKSEGEDPSTAKISVPEGALIVVDAQKAKTDPANSVLARVPAGCSPVRAAIAPDGSSVWVTMRNGDAVAGFNAAKLLTEADHARFASIPVGRAPVGIAVTVDGKHILSADSNRFAAGSGTAQSLSVIDPKRVAEGTGAVLGTIEAGSFPRELAVSSDGKMILLTNYLSNSLQLIDAQHLPMKK
jgi:DNA-binding beta-propeller fold protein YncE